MGGFLSRAAAQIFEPMSSPTERLRVSTWMISLLDSTTVFAVSVFLKSATADGDTASWKTRMPPT
jgi:hypothetical protein